MKVKFIRMLIAAMCAAAMTTSCVVGSVGAFKAPEGSSQNLIERVNGLNVRLNNCKVDIKAAYNKLSDFFNEAERTKFNDEKSAKKLKDKNGISIVSRYIGNLVFDYLMMYNKIGGLNYLDDLVDKEIYDDAGVTEISQMLDQFEKHVKVLCDKIDGLSADWEKNCLIYTEKSNSISLEESKTDNNGRILKYYLLKDFIKQDVLNVASDVNQIAKRAKQRRNLTVDLYTKGENYNFTCLTFHRWAKFLGITESLSGELQQEVRKLTGRNDDSLKISAYRIEEFKQNIDNLKFATSQIEKVTTMLKKMMTSAEMNSKLIDKIRSTVNELIDKMLEEQSLKDRERFTTAPEFKFKENSEKFLKILDFVKTWNMANENTGKGDLSDNLQKHIDGLNGEYVDLITLYTTDYNDVSQKEWVEKVKTQAAKAKEALNTLLENMSAEKK